MRGINGIPDADSFLSKATSFVTIAPTITFDDELALDRRADQPRLGIAGNIETSNGGLDRTACINNIG
jgi:hypothetical protein